VHKLETTDTSLPHSLKALEDALKTLASNLDRVHSQLLFGEKAFGNSESLLGKLVVVGEGREVHAELCEWLAKGSVCEDHLVLLLASPSVRMWEWARSGHRETYDVLDILTAVLGLQEVNGLSTLGRDGRAADLRR